MRRILLGLVTVLSLPAPACADTPRVLWEGRPVRAPAVAPTLAGDTLWVVGSERRIVSLNARTGKRHWRRTLPATACVSPVPAGNRLLLGLGDLEPTLAAVDRRRGRTLWSKRLASAPVAVLVRDSLAIVAGADGKVEAFALSDGASRWEQWMGRPLVGAALAESSLCVLARRDSLWLVHPVTGARRAAWALYGARTAPPAAAGGRFRCPRYGGEILSLDAMTGAIADSVQGPTPQIASVSILGDQMVAVATGGEVECFRLPSMTVEWSRATGETVSTGAIGWNQGWIVLSEKGRVLGLTRDRGQTAWTLQLPNPISTPAACGEKLLAIIDNRGRVVVHSIDGSP